MKIRNGFVSNSSSSSFIIYKELLTKKQKFEVEKWLKEKSDESDIFRLNSYINSDNYLFVNFHNYSNEWYNLVEKIQISDNDIFYFDPFDF